MQVNGPGRQKASENREEVKAGKQKRKWTGKEEHRATLRHSKARGEPDVRFSDARMARKLGKFTPTPEEGKAGKQRRTWTGKRDTKLRSRHYKVRG